jgi:hypothetical protein
MMTTARLGSLQPLLFKSAKNEYFPRSKLGGLDFQHRKYMQMDTPASKQHKVEAQGDVEVYFLALSNLRTMCRGVVTVN